MKRVEFTGLTTTFGEDELKMLVHRHMERETDRLFDREVRLRFEIDFQVDANYLLKGAVVRVMREIENGEE